VLARLLSGASAVRATLLNLVVKDALAAAEHEHKINGKQQICHARPLPAGKRKNTFALGLHRKGVTFIQSTTSAASSDVSLPVPVTPDGAVDDSSRARLFFLCLVTTHATIPPISNRPPALATTAMMIVVAEPDCSARALQEHDGFGFESQS
jgi:hypothetical protein